jgi:hypothetical protein
MEVVALGFIADNSCSVCLVVYEYEDTIRDDMGATKNDSG